MKLAVSGSAASTAIAMPIRSGITSRSRQTPVMSARPSPSDRAVDTQAARDRVSTMTIAASSANTAKIRRAGRRRARGEAQNQREGQQHAHEVAERMRVVTGAGGSRQRLDARDRVLV